MTAALAQQLNGRRVVASVSGGKDSAALSLWLTEQGIDHDRVFLDTGWEHPATYEYLRGELTRAIGPIVEVRGPLGMRDLILKKAMFPSRRRRFCTEHLKVKPMLAYLRQRMDGGEDVVNAVGIRAEESEARARLAEWEWADGFDCETWRPLIGWSMEDVVAIHRRHGLAPNPLYLMGATRVGCWPCIYARKAEVRLIADVSPERIEEIAQLEAELTERAGAPRAWFQDPLAREGTLPIAQVVEWSRTSQGGRQYEMLADAGRDQGCMRWGLCETEAAP